MFQPSFEAQTKTITFVFAQLARWIAPRLKQMQQLEQATRAFPIIRFYNTAVTLYMDSSQHHTLNIAPQRSFGQMLGASGSAFGSGVAWVGTSVRQELVLPRYLMTFAQMLGVVIDSLDRYPRATPGMFDLLTPRRISDIIGQAGLFLRALATSRPQVTTVLTNRHLVELMHTPGRDWGALLRDAIPYIVGAMLLLPLAFVWLDSFIRSASLNARLLLLDEFQKIERQVFGIRNDIIDLFADLAGIFEDAWGFAEALSFALTANLSYYLTIAYIFFAELDASLPPFARQLAQAMNYWIFAFNAIDRALTTIMNADLMPFLFPLGSSVGLRLTLDDLVSAATGAASVSIQLIAVKLAELENMPLLPDKYRVMIQALREVLSIAASPRPFIAETAIPSLTTASFPDFYAELFAPILPGLRTAVGDIGTTLATNVGRIMRGGATLLEGTARAMRREARRAAHMGSIEAYQSLAANADTLADSVFGSQARELRDRISRRRDPLAEAFERAVASGGFHIVGAVIPEYVAQMRRYWDRELDTAETRTAALPTSPHILARRARVGTVRVPRMNLRSEGRALDDDLIARIAAQFRGAVQEAFSTGEGNATAAASAG